VVASCNVKEKTLKKTVETVIFDYQTVVVTNCSKEQPGSIVTKTLENEISIPIATSKELDFNADFKYINFVKFSLTHLQKCGIFYFLPEGRSRMRVYLFVFFYFCGTWY